MNKRYYRFYYRYFLNEILSSCTQTRVYKKLLENQPAKGNSIKLLKNYFGKS